MNRLLAKLPVSLYALLFVALNVLSSDALAKDELRLLFMASSGQQRTAWVDIIRRFEAENPDIAVKHSEYSQEEYKRDFEQRIARDTVDVAFWFAGERLQHLAERKLLTPMDESFVKSVARFTLNPSALNGSVVDGKHFGFPISYYPWGFFYRKSLFQKLGLKPPQNWKEFLAACETLKAANITPTATGAESGWPAAAWFDLLNLRINGLAYHQKLLRGNASFGDARVRKVFEEWKKLLDKSYFLAGSNSMEWDAVLPYLYRNQVGMVLMGGFAAAKFPPGEVTDDIGFFSFPQINPQLPIYEEAPLDVLVLPASGRNRPAAHRLLTYLAKSNELNQYNEIVRQISPLSAAKPGSDPFLRSFKATLDKSAGISFFFDRDAKQNKVKPAFDAFRLFLTPPHDIDVALRALNGP